MAQLLIRDLDDKVLRLLKKRAAHNKRSLQAELKSIMERAATVEAIDPQALADRIQRMLAGREHSDSTELIREDRQR